MMPKPSQIALTPLILMSYCLFLFTGLLQANGFNKLTTQEFNDFHQCDKKFEYDIYFLGGKVGYLHRTIKWQNKAALPKATVTSVGKVSFFWLDSTYQQKSNMQYSALFQHFLTESFSQKLTGIKAKEMKAEMSDNGLSSRVTLNTELAQYQQNNENKNQPLYDLDTLGIQIRLNLLQGKKHFKLSRQASNRIENYQFEVAGLEVIHHEKWGELTTIKVIEVGKHKSTVLWFSSQHDHQLIKAELDMIFSPVVWLSHFSMQCDVLSLHQTKIKKPLSRG